jgi:ABC-2 type transport system permease protein
MRDVWTVVWREWREFKDQLLSMRRGGLSAVILAVVLGIITPIQMGPAWVNSPITLVYWPFLSASMVSSLIADSIAGERERHTLETLLASRLHDSAILVGKVLAAVLYGLLFAVVNLSVGWVAVNLTHRSNGITLFEPEHLVVLLILITLGSALAAGAGVFISLRAASVKQAQQTFGVATLVLFLGPVLTVQALSPDNRVRLFQFLSSLDRVEIERWAITLLFAGSMLLLLGGKRRFRRGKLSLD